MNLCNILSQRMLFVMMCGSLCGVPEFISATQLHVPASCWMTSSDGKVFFVGSGVDTAAQHTLCGGNREENKCVPMMSNAATVNGMHGEKNPLYGAAIAHMALIEETNMFGIVSNYKPVVVTVQDPATVYCVEQYVVAPEKDEQQAKVQAEKQGNTQTASGVQKSAPGDSEKEKKKSVEKKDNDADAKKEEEKQDRTVLGAAQNIKDSASAVTSGIVALRTVSSPALIIAAVMGHGGVWGASGSGIALLETKIEEREMPVKASAGQEKQESPEPRTERFHTVRQCDAWVTKPENSTVTRAAVLDVKSDAIKIGSDLSSLGSVVDMHWDALLGRLYIALQPTAGAGAQDGARSIVVGFLEPIIEIDEEATKKKAAEKKAQSNQKENKENQEDEVVRKRRYALCLYPICPDAVCGNAGESIVSVRGASAQVCAYAVRTMATSTYLHYLVVQGGSAGTNQSDPLSKRTVYALPLMSNRAESGRLANEIQTIQSQLEEKKKSNDQQACKQLQDQIIALAQKRHAFESAHGVLANKNEEPCATDIFGEAAPCRLADRNFRTGATTASEVPTVQDQAACVGGGPLAAGDITSLSVRGDSVFVTVGDSADAQQKAGIFYSQALFDSSGKIKNWTQWCRAGMCVSAAGDCQKLFCSTFDAAGQVLCMTGDAQDKVVEIKRMGWTKGSEKGTGMVEALNKLFEKEPAGVLGLFDFPAGIPGLNESSVLAAIGSRLIVLAHTGLMVDGVLVPNRRDFVSDQRVISFVGGDVQKIAPLTCVEIAQHKNTGLLCASGVGGVAVLVDVSGKGWQDLRSVAQLPGDMHWKKIIDTPFVSKLIYDDGFLYALSDTKLLRVDLSVLDLSAENLTVAAAEIARVDSIAGLGKWGTFTDLVISGKLAVLGTSKGLLRVADGCDVRTLQNVGASAWTPVALPEQLDMVTRLLPISVTGRAQDVARADGGMLYVLDMSPGKNKGHVVRFSVDDIQAKTVDNSCLQLLPDCFFKGLPGPFIDFENYKDQFVTDGALHLVMRNRDGEQASSVHALSSFVRTGYRGAGKATSALPIDMSKAHDVSGAVRCSATGSWLIGGDMGVYINE